jgi:hypothetical protein
MHTGRRYVRFIPFFRYKEYLVTSAAYVLIAVLATTAQQQAPGETPAKQAAATGAPAGPAPRLMFLKADKDGKIFLAVMRPNPNPPQIGGNPRGAFVPMLPTNVELKDLRDLKISTPTGKKIELADAVKKLAGGGLVVAPTDGKAIAPGWLNSFREDVIVLTSPDLTGMGGFGGGGIFMIPGGRPNPAPQPAPRELGR